MTYTLHYKSTKERIGAAYNSREEARQAKRSLEVEIGVPLQIINAHGQPVR